MSGGPVQELGATTRSMLDVFRAQPVLLAMILMNVALIGFIFFVTVHDQRERSDSLKLLNDNRKSISDLLARCYSPPMIR